MAFNSLLTLSSWVRRRRPRSSLRILTSWYFSWSALFYLHCLSISWRTCGLIKLSSKFTFNRLLFSFTNRLRMSPDSSASVLPLKLHDSSPFKNFSPLHKRYPPWSQSWFWLKSTCLRANFVFWKHVRTNSLMPFILTRLPRMFST